MPYYPLNGIKMQHKSHMEYAKLTIKNELQANDDFYNQFVFGFIH